jgi:hypothetical protein
LQRRASDVQDGIVPTDLLNDDDGFEPADEDVATPDKAVELTPAAAPVEAAPVDVTAEAIAPADAVTEDMIEASPQ